MKFFKYLFFSLAVLYIPALLIISLFSEAGDSSLLQFSPAFVFALLTICTLPFYFAFIELGLTVCRAFEKNKRTVKEKIFDIIGIALVASIVIITIIAYTVPEMSQLIVLLIATSVLLLIKWIVYAIICKKKPDFEMFKQKA